jgi:hypothetical protein
MTTTDSEHAFCWTTSPGMTDLGALDASGLASQTNAGDGSGSMVVGWSDSPADGADRHFY